MYSQPPGYAPYLQGGEESTSAGGGNLNFNAVTVSPTSDSHGIHKKGTHCESDKDFFTQLGRQRQNPKLSGYYAFHNQDSEEQSDSSSSGAGSGIEFYHNTPPGHGNTQGLADHDPDDGLITNFGPFPSSRGSDSDSRNPRAVSERHESKHSPQEAKLIEFGNFEIPAPIVSITTAEPVVPEALFDPWGVTLHCLGKSPLEVSNLLGLDSSDDHSQVSDVQSEVRTVGAKQFTDRLEKMTSNDRPKLSQDLDPFSPLVSAEQGKELTPVPVITLLDKPLTSQSSRSHHSHDHLDPFGPMTIIQSSSDQTIMSGMSRNVSTPATLSSLGQGHSSTGGAVPNGKINMPALDVPIMSMLDKSVSHSQPTLSGDLAMFQGRSGNKTGYQGTASYKTSKMGGSLRSSPVPFASHTGSSSTHSSADPFAQLNTQQMAGYNSSSSKPKISSAISGSQQTASSKRSPTKRSLRSNPVSVSHAGSSDSHSSGDPFAQFDIQQMVGNNVTSSKPRVSNTTASQPGQKSLHPAYKPYYMQQNQQSMAHAHSQPQVSGVAAGKTSPMSGSSTKTSPMPGSSAKTSPMSSSSGSTPPGGATSNSIFPPRSTSSSRSNYNPVMESGTKTGQELYITRSLPNELVD